jgi:hypothetical protein
MGFSPYIKLLGPASSKLSGQPSSATKHSSATDTSELEEVECTFQKIEMSNVADGTSSQDSWDTGNGDGNSNPKPKHTSDLGGYAYQVKVPFDIATGLVSGKRRWTPIHRKAQLVLPSSSVLAPQLQQAYVSQTTIASIVMNWGPFGRDKLRLANVHVMNFVPHGGHSGQVGDYIAFDILADLLGTVAA